MTEPICKECGKSRKLGRRLCTQCNTKRVVAFAQKKFPTHGRYVWNKRCEACGNQYKALRKSQRICKDCYSAMKTYSSENPSAQNYNYTNIPGRTEHRDLAEKP